MAKAVRIIERIVANLEKAHRLLGRPANTVFIGSSLYLRLNEEYNKHYVTGDRPQMLRLIAGAELIPSFVVTNMEGEIDQECYEVVALPDFEALSRSPLHNQKLKEQRP